MAAGRPRAFDVNQALDRAMDVFWREGYEGASLSDLTAAMGINSPSLYAAFGNKEQLFRAALDRYDERRAPFMEWVLNAPTAREAARRYLLGPGELTATPEDPPGCLLVQGGLSCGTDCAAIPEELARRRAAFELALRTRFERAKTEGDLPETADPAILARYIGTVSNGLGIQATGGAGREELRKIGELALQGWPA